MRYTPEKKQITWGIVCFTVIAASMILYSFLFHGSDFAGGFNKVMRSMMAVTYGIIIAYILNPVLIFAEEKLLVPLFRCFGADPELPENYAVRKHMRKISIFFTMTVFILLLIGLISTVVPQLIKSIETLIRNFPFYANNVNLFLSRHLEDADPVFRQFINNFFTGLSQKLNDFLRTQVLPSLTSILQIISKRAVVVFSQLLNFTIGIIVAIYVLNSKELFTAQAKKLAYAFFKEDTANRLIAEFRFIHYTFTGFFVGKIIDSILVGLICLAGNNILKIPFPELVAVIVGVTNVIPFFGPYIGEGIGFFLVFMIDPAKGIIFLIFVLVLQQIDGNILGPAILGSSTGLSSFWVMFSILIFGAFWGVPGLLVGVPAFAVIYDLVARYANHQLKKRILPTDTNVYIHTSYIENGNIITPQKADRGRYNIQKPGSTFIRVFSRKKKKENREIEK